MLRLLIPRLPILTLIALAPGEDCPAPDAASRRAAAEEEPASALPGLDAALAREAHSIALHALARPSIVTVTAFERVAGKIEDGAPVEGAWTLQLENDYPGFRRIGAGSGVVVNAGGDILTNRHFLLKEDGEPADLVDVETHDNQHTISRVVGMEPTLDMAVVRLEVFAEGNPPDFRPIRMGDSGSLLPGNEVFVLGDPFGPDSYFGRGMLTGTPTRECYQEQLTAAYLQLALVAHPGAYGGALLNLRGEYMGMLLPRDPALARAGAGTGKGIEFALPSNIIQGLYATIARNQSFRSPWLGVAVMGVGELHRELGVERMQALARPRVGIYVENVFNPSPAAAAGVRPGDFLTKFNDELIGSPLDFQKQLYLNGIDRTASIGFFRAGETYERKILIEARPPEATTR